MNSLKIDELDVTTKARYEYLLEIYKTFLRSSNFMSHLHRIIGPVCVLLHQAVMCNVE
jgi:hypothetical protein